MLRATLNFTGLKTLFTKFFCLSLSLSLVAPSTSSAFFGQTQYLNDSTVKGLSSVYQLDFSEAQVLRDNDHSFEAKLQVIEKAQTTLDMAYFIFALDYSSAYLMQKLIQKGASHPNLKVRLLLDYNENYKRLDILSYLQQAFNENVRKSGGKGSLEVRLYNKPTTNILRDAAFLTLPCPSGAKGKVCSAAKIQAVDQAIASGLKQIPGTNSGLLLSGIYSKSGELMVSSILKGQQIDLAKFKGGSQGMSAEDKAGLKELAKLIYKAKFGGLGDKLAASIQLSLAMSLHGEKVAPIIDAISEHLPVDIERSEAGKQDWVHLTDFLHHKLLMADGQSFVLGGRNIEDSYHMSPNPMVTKYIFEDTDLAVELKAPSQKMLKSFEQLFGFSEMMASLDEVRAIAPNDVIANLTRAEENCVAKGVSEKEALKTCQQTEFESNFASLEERIRDIEAKTNKLALEYLAKYKNNSAIQKYLNGSPLAVDAGARLSYFENLPYSLKNPNKRTYGALVNQEETSGKYIHALWKKAALQACVDKTSILMHNAYFFPPANMMGVFGDMIYAGQGRDPVVADCSQTKINIITNSIETTDLNVVNFASRQSTRAISKIYRSHQNPKKAQIEIFEYTKASGSDNRSLHSKVAVFGDDLFIGSANLDPRSLMMDSNNGIYVEAAPLAANEYIGFAQGLISSKRAQSTAPSALMDDATFSAIDAAMIEGLVAKYRLTERLQPERVQQIRDLLLSIFKNIQQLSTESILRDPQELNWFSPDESGFQGPDPKRIREQKQNDFNRRYQLI